MVGGYVIINDPIDAEVGSTVVSKITVTRFNEIVDCNKPVLVKELRIAIEGQVMPLKNIWFRASDFKIAEFSIRQLSCMLDNLPFQVAITAEAEAVVTTISEIN